MMLVEKALEVKGDEMQEMQSVKAAPNGDRERRTTQYVCPQDVLFTQLKGNNCFCHVASEFIITYHYARLALRRYSIACHEKGW